jgi:hypothetical protein
MERSAAGVTMYQLDPLLWQSSGSSTAAVAALVSTGPSAKGTSVTSVALAMSSFGGGGTASTVRTRSPPFTLSQQAATIKKYGVPATALKGTDVKRQLISVRLPGVPLKMFTPVE